MLGFGFLITSNSWNANHSTSEDLDVHLFEYTGSLGDDDDMLGLGRDQLKTQIAKGQGIQYATGANLDTASSSFDGAF